MYYDCLYTANNDSLIFSMVLVSICWCFDSSSSDVFLSFSWLFKSSLVSFIIFFITDLTHNAFSTLASVSSGVCNLSCSAFHFLYWYWISSSCLLRFPRCPVRPGWIVYSDEWRAYRQIQPKLGLQHETVNHYHI